MSAWSNSTLLTTAMSGRYFRNFAVLSKNALSYSSPSMTKSRPLPDPVARRRRRRSSARCRRRARSDRRPPLRQQPPGQRRRRRLAVRAGDDDRARAPEEVLADRLGQRAVADLAIEHFLELRVAARDGVADDDQIEVRRDVLGGVAVERRDALAAQEVAHRRIDVLIGPAHVEAPALQHRGQRRHGRAADADQMNPLHGSADGQGPPPPRSTSAAAGAVDHAARRRRAAASSPAPAVWPDGKPNRTGPGKSREQVAP